MISARALLATPVVSAVRAWLRAGYVGPDAPLVVACSGGADSLALAAAVTAVTDPGRVRVAAVIDHGLQDDSAAVVDRTSLVLRDLGFRDVVARRVQVGVAGRMDGGMEAAARDARYRALSRIAADVPGDAAVLLAHTADDQAETVLLGLGRGSGPRSIAGMRPWTRPWGRPLLGVRRSETENTCQALGLEPWQDPQNADRAFSRVRLRHEAIPLLDEILGGGVVPALARTSELMAEDLVALDDIAHRALVESRSPAGDLVCQRLAAWPVGIRRRVLRRWVREDKDLTSLTYRHLVRMDDLAISGRSGAAVRLPGPVDVVRIDGELHLLAAD